MHLPQAKLDQVLDRFREVEARMAAASDGQEIVRLSKEHAELRPVAEAAQALAKARADRAEAEELSRSDDASLADYGREEMAAIDEALPETERALALLLAPRDADENASAILEVRAGTGGDEAALFAGDLFRMYQRYADSRGWKTELVSLSEGAAGGYREAVFVVRGPNAYGDLRWESGVHRVQRVPATEAQGRIHTSAATVAVLPEAEEVDVQINPGDLKIDVYRSSGPGGQSVNTTDSAVRITHLPTGLVVTCQDEKSQHKNKDKAMSVLRSRLLDARIAEQEAERARDRRLQVGTGDRSAKIRTYNFPQSRVTDHRIGWTTHALPQVLDGALGELLEALKLASQSERAA